MEFVVGALIGIAAGFLAGYHIRSKELQLAPQASSVAYVPIGDCEQCAAIAMVGTEDDWAASLERSLPTVRRTLDRRGHCTRCGSDQITRRRLEFSLPTAEDVERGVRQACKARAGRAPRLVS